MASETSAVLVAVRVRPLNSRESPFECTVSVVDDHTVTLTDITGVTSSSNTAVGIGAGGGIGGSQHVFTFDKIFWSVPPDVLPVSMSDAPPQGRFARFTCQDSLVPSSVSRTTSIGFDVVSRSCSINSFFPDTASQSGGARASSGCLPCFASVPKYDDQESIYEYIGPRIYNSVMAGYNSCIFAYGQTGSGKTHSLLGPPECFALRSVNRGIIPRLCEDVFELMRKERDEDVGISYNVECSFLEIYCERVRDLLVHCNTGSTCGANSSNGATSVTGSMCTQISSVSAPQSLRIRQHPTRGPYVEGLSLLKVRDADAVIRHLTAGLRERVTAETKMNEHSSRSHAVLQLHITRVAVVPEEGEAAVITTKTRSCKVNMVDLAGSERVTQSGASGDRFEEARNINLSLTTLGRVILQLTEKQSGKHVIPAYRDSVLTWLLSDSLGGNSKTIMLATIAPSAYCYQQTLNTLRFAGLTKKVINVATVNEDHHFQKLIAALRQQIVKLTLQLEEGKAAEVFNEEIRALRSDRNELEARIDSMRLAMSTMVQSTEVAALERRAAELEKSSAQLQNEKTQLQRKLVSTTTALREELMKKGEEIAALRESLAQKSVEVQELNRRHRMAMEQRPPWRENEFEKAQKKIDVEEALKARKALQLELETLQREHCGVVELLETTQRRLSEKAQALDVAQSDLKATKKLLRLEREDNSAEGRERDFVKQLECIHQDYLREKQTNVDLLMRLSEAEVQASKTHKYILERTRDINELESLLLEETETSERYYIQLRYSFDVFTLAMFFARNIFLVLTGCKGVVGNRRIDIDSTVVNNNSGGSIAAFTLEEAPYDCIHSEKYGRALLEKECFSTLLELHAQRTTLRELCGAAEANAELIALRASATEALEEMERLRKKIATMELTIEAGKKENVVMQCKLHNSESARNRLELQVEEMKEEVMLLQSSNDARIQKIVEAQSLRNVLCAHGGDGQVSLTTTSAKALSGAKKKNSDNNTLTEVVKKNNAKLPMKENHCYLEGSKLEKTKSKQKQEQENEKLRLDKEIVHYQEQLGVLRAQLEKERNEKLERTRALDCENEALKRELQRVRDECRVSLKKSTDIVRDYEVHVSELQQTVTTLQSALEEEYSNTDRARDEAERMSIEKREALASLSEMTQLRDAMQLALGDSEQRFSSLKQQVCELQTAYNFLEQKLAHISLPAADVYLTVDCSDKADGNSNWMEKAMREKELLEQQKEVVRRLNEELLATVRERNLSVRNVHRQITKLQRGGMSPDMTEVFSVNDESPLGAQLIQ